MIPTLLILLALAAESPKVTPPPTPTAPKPSDSDISHYWRSYGLYQTLSVQFQASLTAKQKELIEQMGSQENELKSAYAALARACGPEAIIDGISPTGFPTRSGDPSCLPAPKPPTPAKEGTK